LRTAASFKLGFDRLCGRTRKNHKGVFGVNLGHMWGEFDRMRPWMDQLIGLWNSGAIKPKIARVFKFDEAPAAHHFIQDRKNIGKVLLAP
jgi:NADPH:quinone reductase-like Zn-dependent oxidoreductase